jgi:spermidine synthase
MRDLQLVSHVRSPVYEIGTMRLLSAIPSAVLTITTAGFVATVAQIIVLRELLVLFYGNELSAGLIFAGWLLWSGLGSALSGKWALKVSAPTTLLGLMLVFLSAMLPLSVFFIRATRIIWALPAGELASIGKMLLISIATTGLFCPVSGALFGICWAIHRKKDKNQPLGIYLGEALGSAAGGLLFYFIFLPYGSVFTTIWITSGAILCISWWLFRPWRPLSKVRFEHLIWIAVSLLIVSGTISGSRLDHMSRRWQWGPNLAAVYDTAFHNIALLKKEEQVSVFTNGLWLFSEPDRLSAEHGVHLALLQHPNPKTILLLGGGIAGLLEELLKQPGIRHIDYVEPDPDLIPLLKPHLSSATDASLQHPRVRLFHQDPRIFMRRSHKRYDVILMNIGDPITAQMNRFYTKEFFTHVKQRLGSGGIFSFAVSGGESMLGPTQARFLGSIKKTLLQIFPNTLIYPGDQTRFFATDITGVLLSDYTALADRISERNLQLTYVREDILQDALSPFRLDYLKSILEGITGVAVNRDFFPICYFHNLMMWASQWHAGLQKFLNTLVDLELRWLWAGWAFVGVLIVAIFWTGRCKFRAAVAGSIFVSGAVEMVLQMVFLLSFQIIAGFVYRQLALIIAFFMTGLAVGAGWISWQNPSHLKTNVTRRRFIGIQVLICMLPLGLMLFLPLIHGEIRNFLSLAVIGWLFSGLSLITGILGGIHFALAVMVMAGTGVASEKIGGGLYALDLAGAAAGVLIAALFIIPIYGIMNTLVFLSTLCGISLLTLLRQY